MGVPRGTAGRGQGLFGGTFQLQSRWDAAGLASSLPVLMLAEKRGEIRNTEGERASCNTQARRGPELVSDKHTAASLPPSLPSLPAPSGPPGRGWGCLWGLSLLLPGVHPYLSGASPWEAVDAERARQAVGASCPARVQPPGGGASGTSVSTMVPGFEVFAHFCGIRTPTMADFMLST